MSDELETVAANRDRWHEAVVWHAHFREASEAELQERMHAWQEWESEDQNRRIFDHVSSLLEDSSRTRKRRLPDSDGTDIYRTPDGSSFPPPSWCQPRHLPVARPAITSDLKRLRRARLMAFAAAAAAVLCMATLPVTQSIWRIDRPNVRPQIHETALGEVRSDPLADGSIVILGAQSAISVQFSTGRRAVRLERGEAWFKVAHNANRPFVVTAGPRTITAVGTAFVVQKRADEVIVTVTDGSVEVAPRPSADAKSIILRALRTSPPGAPSRVARGERMLYQDGGSASAIEHADTQAATAWSDGQLEFDHLPLRYVVQVVNRYSHRTITVDQLSGDQIFTGLVLQNRVDEWIRRLADIYPVEIAEHGEAICVRARGRESGPNPSPCDNSY